MSDFLSADAVKDIVKDAVSEAVKAVNTVADEDRPAAVKSVNVVKRAYGLPKVGVAMKATTRGNDRGAEFERDFSQAAAEVFGYGSDREGSRSIFWPKTMDEAVQVLDAMGESKHADLVNTAKAMAEGTTGAGGAMVPPQYLQEAFAYALTPGIVVRNLPGVTVMPVKTGTTVYLPREDVRAGGASAAEAASLSAQDVTFAQQAITLKKQYGYRQFSNELLADADPAWNQFITKTLLRDVALYQDAQYLEGAGTGNFVTGFAAYGSTTTGPIPGTAGGTNGGTVVLDNILDAVYNLRAVNVEPQQGSGFFIMHPRTLNTLTKIKDTTGNYIVSSFQGVNTPMYFGGQLPGSNGPKAMLLGVPVYLTSQIGITNTVGTSTDCSNIYVGDASKVIILERQGIELAFSDQVGFASDQSAWRAIGRSAVAITQPTALEVIKGVRA
jgi:HK97 family phage major capsid protein